ncbi:MAG TPA: hypothetical protein DCW44_02305 [Eubacterium sp.]|nr:hypothetical protein [Eubacterium sp.]
MINDDIMSKLKIKQLEPALYIKNFVNNEELCNYEKYLLEFINQSSFFRNLSEGEKYKKPLSEENGQSDANSDKYKIDFKLFEASSYIEGKSIYSSQKTLLMKGAVISHLSKEKGQTLGVNLYNEVRKIKSTKELSKYEEKFKKIKKMYRNEDNIDDQVKCELSIIVENLNKNKNLLFFFPREFNYKGECDDEQVLDVITRCIYEDFGILYRYRCEKGISNKDTFFSCVYKERFLIFKFGDTNAELIEQINISNSDTFSYLYTTYNL